jgi:hypothetical protein
MKKFLGVLLSASCLLACNQEGYLPDYTGKTGELIVVIENKYNDGKAGEAIQSTFAEYTPGLPQEEPLFTVVTIPSAAFNKVLQRHRNIVIVDINSNNTKSNISIENHKWAKNQLVLKISAPDDSVFANIIQKNRNTLIQYFQDKELERLAAGITKKADPQLSEKIQKKFQFQLKIPKEYQLLLDTTDFIWFRYETEKPQGGQMHPVNRNLFVFARDYYSEKMFDLDQVIASMDSVTRLYIHGQREGSYLKVFAEYPTHEKAINLKNNYTKELRGLWHLQSDFMGGPFVSYTTVNPLNNKIITIVSFLFAPQFDKREYLREMEAIMQTAGYK